MRRRVWPGWGSRAAGLGAADGTCCRRILPFGSFEVEAPKYVFAPCRQAMKKVLDLLEENGVEPARVTIVYLPFPVRT